MEDPVPSASGTPNVQDLTVRYRARLLRTILWLSIPAGTLHIIPLSLGMPKIVCQLGLMCGFFVGSLLLERAYAWPARKKLRVLMAQTPAGPAALRQTLVQTLEDYCAIAALSFGGFVARHSVLGAAAEMLLHTGHAGTAFRLADDPATLKPLPPALDVPVEPVPLNVRSPAFIALTGAPPFPQRRLQEMLQRAMSAYGRSRWTRGFGLACLVLAAFGFVIIIYHSILDVFAGLIPGMLADILPVFAFMALFGVWQLRRTYAWFIVPAALVVCSSNWRSKSWDTHLLTRSQSVLMYWATLHTLAIASPHGSYCRRATPQEAELAFLAWLSPLAPPPPEQLTDLR